MGRQGGVFITSKRLLYTSGILHAVVLQQHHTLQHNLLWKEELDVEIFMTDLIFSILSRIFVNYHDITGILHFYLIE